MNLKPELTHVPLTPMRKAIVRSMTESAAIPQFTIEMDVSVGALLAARASLASTGGGPSITDALIGAAAAALVIHPMVNASFLDDSIVLHGEINVGIAVALTDGLIVPAVRQADRLTLREIQVERSGLTERARAGALRLADVTSGTFTISNMGPAGVTRFRALVLPPQAAILAVGSVTGSQTMCLSLSCDHRVLDGVPAALFLGDLKARLEDPAWILDGWIRSSLSEEHDRVPER